MIHLRRRTAFAVRPGPPLSALALLAGLSGALPASAGQRDYETVRWAESWAWLADSPERGEDAFDPVKWVELGEHWHFTLGGSARLRFEHDSNRTLGASPVTEESRWLFRTFLHGDLWYRQAFRWFWEVRYSDAWSEERPVAAVFRDDPDFQNFFLEATAGAGGKVPVTFRVGRQELLLGAQRLVSPLDWSSTRRTFDGVSVTAASPRTETVVFATRPVAHEPHDIDSPMDGRLFAGVHSTWRPDERHLVDAYTLLRRDSRAVHLPQAGGEAGDLARRTWGARYRWAAPRWSFETEWALQDGHVATDDIDAWFGTAEIGRHWREAPWKPSLLLGLDVASGDADSNDATLGTFDQLFPLGHAYFGHLDLVARQNVRAARLQLVLRPHPRITWSTWLHRFELERPRDSLYQATGAPIRRDSTGKAGRDVGTELDVLIQLSLGRHQSLAVEVAHLWSGKFVEETGSGRDATFAWLAWQVVF